jgi:hypothetical protein
MTPYLQFKDANLIISSMEALVFHIHSLSPLSSKMNHPNSPGNRCLDEDLKPMEGSVSHLTSL